MEWMNQNAGAVQAVMAIMIEMTLFNRFQGHGTSSGVKKSESVSGTIVVTNKGNLPLKSVSIAVKRVYDNHAFPDRTTTVGAQRRVVSPDKTADFRLTLDVPLGSSQAAQFEDRPPSDLYGEVSLSSHSSGNRHRYLATVMS